MFVRVARQNIDKMLSMEELVCLCLNDLNRIFGCVGKE